MHRPIATSLAALAAFVTTAAACLWDDDTLRHEAAGAPGLLEVLVGRFDRFPAAYYERRLEIAAQRVSADPDGLAAYDNAGVACDRLGRHGEAIEWMGRKRDALDRLAARAGAPDAEHEYRSLANLGTFHAHRWLAGGADRSDLEDLEIAERLIADAIALNPDAHFGRERYQLLAIRWLRGGPAPTDRWGLPTIFDAAESAADDSDRVAPLEPGGAYDDAVEGLAGLIRLGNAWESVDIHYALHLALCPTGGSSLSRVSSLRLGELLRNGKRSLSVGWVDYAALDDLYTPDEVWRNRAKFSVSNEGMARGGDEIDAWFEDARREADDWRAARNRYVTDQLNAGRHPDTHSDFWAGWAEPHQMPAPPNGVVGLQGGTLIAAALLGAPLLLFGSVLVLGLRRRLVRSAAPAS